MVKLTMIQCVTDWLPTGGRSGDLDQQVSFSNFPYLTYTSECYGLDECFALRHLRIRCLLVSIRMSLLNVCLEFYHNMVMEP